MIFYTEDEVYKKVYIDVNDISISFSFWHDARGINKRRRINFDQPFKHIERKDVSTLNEAEKRLILTEVFNEWYYEVY